MFREQTDGLDSDRPFLRESVCCPAGSRAITGTDSRFVNSRGARVHQSWVRICRSRAAVGSAAPSLRLVVVPSLVPVIDPARFAREPRHSRHSLSARRHHGRPFCVPAFRLCFIPWLRSQPGAHRPSFMGPPLRLAALLCRAVVYMLFPSACGRREHRRAVQLAVRIACLSPLSPQHAGPAAATAPLAGRLPTSNGPPLPCAAVLCRVVPSPLRVDTTGTAALSTPRCPRRAACFSRCPPNTQAPPSPSSGTRPPLCGVTNAWVNPQ